MDIEEQFAHALIRFIRSFGLHKPDRTPCGIDAGVAEAHALSELSAGPLRQMELSERLVLTKSTISRLVDGMVRRGWVERQHASEDGRGVLVSLSAGGLDAAKRVGKARADRLKALLDALPEGRRDEVVEVLTLMEEAARASDPGFAAQPRT